MAPKPGVHGLLGRLAQRVERAQQAAAAVGHLLRQLAPGVKLHRLVCLGVNLQVDRGVLMTRDGTPLVHEFLGHNLFGQMALNGDLERRAPGFQQLTGTAYHLGDKRVVTRVSVATVHKRQTLGTTGRKRHDHRLVKARKRGDLRDLGGVVMAKGMVEHGGRGNHHAVIVGAAGLYAALKQFAVIGPLCNKSAGRTGCGTRCATRAKAGVACNHAVLGDGKGAGGTSRRTGSATGVAVADLNAADGKNLQVRTFENIEYPQRVLSIGHGSLPFKCGHDMGTEYGTRGHPTPGRKPSLKHGLGQGGCGPHFNKGFRLPAHPICADAPACRQSSDSEIARGKSKRGGQV